MNIKKILNRNSSLFNKDIKIHEKFIIDEISKSRFLILGGAGSIGQAVTKEIFKKKPITLHVIDISENNLVELVRDIRSSLGYIDGDFKTFILDCGSTYFEKFFSHNGPYDYVLNLSAVKHVRSEKDPFSLMRMIEVNIIDTIRTLRIAEKYKAKKYFCVSTDKAASPINLMGGSKRIMEKFLFGNENKIDVSTTRFANVAFSDGSLLHSFKKRVEKRQPIVAPRDIKRYFLTPEESGELCLMSCLLGKRNQIFYPKIENNLELISFSEIAKNYISQLGYKYLICNSEEEAKQKAKTCIDKGNWPCYFFDSDTTGEKYFEEFYEKDDIRKEEIFNNIGIVVNKENSKNGFDIFCESIEKIKKQEKWDKKTFVYLFKKFIPDFTHVEKNKHLDEKM